MSAKLGFTAGLAVGLLAGSRAGRGLYDRSAAAATAVVNDPRVRGGASAALHRAGSTGSTVAGAAMRKVKGNGDGEGLRTKVRARVGKAKVERGGEDAGEMGEADGGVEDGAEGGTKRGMGPESRGRETRFERARHGVSGVRKGRLMRGVRMHGVSERGINGSDGGSGTGIPASTGTSTAMGTAGGTDSPSYPRHTHQQGVSAPSVQAKPKGEADQDETD